MVLLKALNLPALTPDVLGFLAGQQVLTVEDFLLQDLNSVAAKAERSLDSSEFNQATRAVLSYLEQLQDGWSLGCELLEESGQFLPISCNSVDSLLGGGLQEGTITELVGASSTGKSQMCMQAAASVACWLHSSVIYVDTCNAFSGKRVANILHNFLGCHEAKMMDQEDAVALMMKGIQRIGIFDIFSMLSFLRSLHESLQSESKIGGEFPYLRLLIIDSASSIVSPILGGTSARDKIVNFPTAQLRGPEVRNDGFMGPASYCLCQSVYATSCRNGHALMISLARCLNTLAIVNRIAVLITNHTVNADDGQIKSALGESWISVPHIRLWLGRDSSSDICEVSLTKHTSLAFYKQAAFHIGTSGLQSIDDMRSSIFPSSNH